MNKLFLLIVSCFLIILVDCYGEEVANEYIVKTTSLKSTKLMNFFTLKQNGRQLLKEWNELQLKHVRLDQRSLDLLKNNYKAEIEYIEPNIIYHVIPVRNIRNPIAPASQWGLKAIDISKAWTREQGNPTVKVAIIDTGIDCKHSALKTHCLKGWNFVTNSPNGIDDNMHGTHCAGIIAANSTKAMGVAPRVSVMAVKFLDSSGSGSLDQAISSIEYAVKEGAKILSNSWGGGDYSQALRDAIKMAGDKGVLFIVAAGNESNDNDATPSYPASYEEPNIISVAATDVKGQLAYFSNFGATSVHIGAPGVDVFSTIPGEKYKSLSGTSMATPFVSGLAALILSHYPNASAEEIKNRILNNASPLDSLSGKTLTGGIINASNSL